MPPTKTIEILPTFEQALPSIENIQSNATLDIYRAGTNQSDVQTRENILNTEAVLKTPEQFNAFVRNSRASSAIMTTMVRIYVVGWKNTGWTGISTREEVEDISTQVPCVIGNGTLLQMDKWGIKDQVNKVPEIIRDTYRSLNKIELTISTDPEIPERRRVRVTLTVTGKPEDVLGDEHQFKEWMYSTLDLKVCELLTITYNWVR